MGTSLIVGSLTQVAACASFGFVARFLWTRFGKGEQRGVVRAFAFLWGSMSVYMAERGILGLAANAGWTSLAVFVGARYLEVLLVCLAAWGMSYYVGYLYTGWRPLRVVFGEYFVMVGIAYASATAAGEPSRIVVGPWAAGLWPETPFIDAIYLSFGLPMLLSTGAYLTLAGRAISPIQRYRVTLTSISLLAWVASGLAASLAGDSFWSFVTITLLGIITAFAVFLAYRPPRFVLEKWAPESLKAPDRRAAEERAERRRARILQFV